MSQRSNIHQRVRRQWYTSDTNVRMMAAAIACTAMTAAGSSAPANGAGAPPTAEGIHKIQHVVVIMQENRSFDSYFGTYPGADGIPMANGKPTVYVPDPAGGGCVRPYSDHADVNAGGPHAASHARADIDKGKMDGFVKTSEHA